MSDILPAEQILFMLKFVIIVFVSYILICLFMYLKQRDLIYFPVPEAHNSQAASQWLINGQHRLKIWRLNEGKPALLYFGGNAESIDGNIADFREMFNAYTVYLMNYRGYGGSSGSPSEQALFDDALALYDEVKKHHSSIHVIGRSLGSGVATYLAAHRDISKLVLITPFDSIKNVAQSHYPFLPVNWLLKDHFDSLKVAASINNPVLVLMAEHDRVIGMKHSKNLIKHLEKSNVESHVIRGTDHNDISYSPMYRELVRGFLDGKGL